MRQKKPFAGSPTRLPLTRLDIGQPCGTGVDGITDICGKLCAFGGSKCGETLDSTGGDWDTRYEDDLHTARKGIFHWMLADSWNGAGTGYRPGARFTACTCWPNITHELGHNLGLTHGGDPDFAANIAGAVQYSYILPNGNPITSWTTVPGQPGGMNARDVSLAVFNNRLYVVTRDFADTTYRRSYFTSMNTSGAWASRQVVSTGANVECASTSALAVGPDGYLDMACPDYNASPPPNIRFYRMSISGT